MNHSEEIQAVLSYSNELFFLDNNQEINWIR